MTDLTMILLALGMVAVFMGPFFIISAIKDRKEAKQKQEENEEKWFIWVRPMGAPYYCKKAIY